MIFSTTIFVLLLATAFGDEGKKNYDGWSVVKVYPETEKQVEYLNSLRENDSGFELQVWQQGNLNRPFDIFLSPKAREQFLATLSEMGIKYKTSSHNIQRALDAENRPVSPRARAQCNIPNCQWFQKFLNLNEIMAAIQTLAKSYPNLISLESIGTTHERRNITMVKLSTNTGKAKPAIWLDGGIHAREWASPATVLFMLNKLVTGYATNQAIKNLVDGATWYIVPVLNPDGYAYTHQGDRMWRKNRRPGRVNCEGVDLNRNFDYGFGGLGTSGYNCEDIYRGPSAFSEPESQAVRNFVLSHKDIKAFLTIHAYSQMWFYPFGDRANSFPDNVDDLARVAQQGAFALKQLYGTRYDVGTAANLLYEAAGGSDDWAKGKAKIQYVYCLELRPDGNADDGFVLPPNQIIPTGEETWAGINVVANAVVNGKIENENLYDKGLL